MAISVDTVTSILHDLIAFDTTSRNSNMQMIDYIAAYLSGQGLSPRIIKSDDGNKANLFVTIGRNIEGGIVLSGHSDVVPVDGQKWSSDPFDMAERDGRFYGRGTADMKGFIACVLAMVPIIADRDLPGPIHLAFSYDEEVGCLGVSRMIDVITAEIPMPCAVIVGEPTNMKIANTHKGICANTTTIHGREAHSSRPQDGVNAIEAAASFVTYLYRLCDELAETERDDRFEPPYTTFNAGKITGGDAVNIIARETKLNWEFRPIPGADADAIAARVSDWVETELLPRMRTTDANAVVETTRDVLVQPFDAPESLAELIAREASDLNSAGAVSFVTEASLFASAGIPAVICGPGDIAQAHQPDEFINRDQLVACLAFLDRMASAPA